MQVSVVPEFQTPEEVIPTAKSHLDNSHTIEITIGKACVRLSNEADRTLLACVLPMLNVAVPFCFSNVHVIMPPQFVKFEKCQKLKNLSVIEFKCSPIPKGMRQRKKNRGAKF